MPESQMAAETTHVQKLIYDGRIGSLYWIFIKNILLGMITLTIYRFWGKTNLRRYIWSHTQLQGERFEYTGTGGELFKGFLIVIGLFICANICWTILVAIFGAQSDIQKISGLFFGPVILFLSLVAIYAAQRYRLTRTSWRGIRGGMSGSAWAYGTRALGYGLLTAMTFGLATPWTQMRLAEQRFNNSYFGDAKAMLEGRSAPVYKGFVLGIVIYIILTAGLVAALWFGLDPRTALSFFLKSANQSQQLDTTQSHATLTFFTAYIIFIVGLVVIGILAFCWYAAAFFRAIADGLSFDNLTFKSTMGASNYLRFWLGNTLIMIFTFGLGLPLVMHRTIVFFADRLEIIGEIDIDRLQQNTLPKPKTGEGLLETFDAGFW